MRGFYFATSKGTLMILVIDGDSIFIGACILLVVGVAIAAIRSEFKK